MPKTCDRDPELCRFGTILADPPWHYFNQNCQGGLTQHYGTLSNSAIEALPVRDVAARDCTLLLWATNPKLPDAFAVLDAWGFEYKTMLTWVKMSAATAPRIGLGYHLRGATEHLLIGTRGEPGIPAPDRRPCSVLFNPIGAHSAKPEAQYDIAEGYPGPYLELFHRPRPGLFPPRPGWVFLGDQATGNDMADDLRALAGVRR